MPVYNVLVVSQFNEIEEDARKEIIHRLEEHGMESIPTIEGLWEMNCEAADETDAKDKAIETFVNICRTYPFELRLVAQCGTSQILRRKKKFEP